MSMITVVQLCPCGCGGAVREGKEYHGAGCYARATRRDPSIDRNAQVTFRAICQTFNPRDSWWLDVPRERWATLIEAQRQRMGMTPFGLMRGNGTTIGDDPSLRDRRQRREAREC